MEHGIDTIKFIGEKNFSQICQELQLTADEIDIVKKVFGAWDGLMVIPDFKERQKKKIAIGMEATQDLSPEKRQRIISAQLRISILFAQLAQRRQ